MKSQTKIQKKLLTLLLSLILCLTIIPQALADGDTPTNYLEMFETESVDGGIQINGFKEEYITGLDGDLTPNVVIPAQIDGEDVVAFAAYAFYTSPYDTERIIAPELIIEVSISEKNTTIGNSAFRGCENLTTLNLPQTSDGLYFGTYSFAGSGVTEFTFYEYMSFAGVTDGSVLTTDSGFIFQYSDVETINFPETWSDENGLMISAYMFNGCPITELNLPSYLSEVGKMAFMSCSITDLNWPETCSIDDGMKFAGSVFKGCDFDVMTLPQYVSQMDDNAFFSVDTLYLPEEPIEQFNIYAFSADPVVVATSKETYTTWKNYDFESAYGVYGVDFSYEFTIQFIYEDAAGNESVAREEIKLYGEQIDYVKDEYDNWYQDGSYTFPDNTGSYVGWASEKNSVAIPYVHFYECVFDTFYEAGTIENQYLYLGQYPQSYATSGRTDGDDNTYFDAVMASGDEDDRYAIVSNTEYYWEAYRYDDIKWQILDKTDNQDGTYTYSLVSDVALHGRDYDASEAGWEDSDIRAWLNGENTVSTVPEGYDNILIADYSMYGVAGSTSLDDDFYGTAFEDWEKDLINTTVVDDLYYVTSSASDEDYYDTTTEDKIYLMSYFDACDYFSTTEMRIVRYSTYASREISSSMKSGNYTKWFTRTTYASGATEYVFIFLATGGTSYTSYVANNYAIRPAMTITVSEDYVTTSGTGTEADPYSFAPIPTYTVTYDANGGTGSVTDTNEYKEDEVAEILENEFTYEGKAFTGWNTEEDGTGDTYTAGDTYTIEEENLTLYAQWADYYTVTYDANGGTGSVIDEGNYLYLEVADILENGFTMNGYHFDSYNTKVDGSGSTYFPHGIYTFVDKDVTLYAIWTKDAPEEEETGNDLDADGTHTEYLGDVENMMDFPHPDEFVVVDLATSNVLTEYVDYEVTLHTHLPGHTTAWVTGINDYAGDDDEVDYIIRQDISDYNGDGRGGIDNSIYWGNVAHEYVYTGDPIEPIEFVTSIIGGLTEDVDYTLTYEDITPTQVAAAIDLYANLPMTVAGENIGFTSYSVLAGAGVEEEDILASVGTKQVTITGIGDVFYGDIVIQYKVVNAITDHSHSMEYDYTFEYDGESLTDDMLATIVVTETTADGEKSLDPSEYTVTFDSTEDDYTTHPGYVNFTVHVTGCEHYLYGTMIIKKDITNSGGDDYIGGIDDTVYIMDDSITTDFAGDYSDISDLYLMDSENDNYMRFLNKYVDGASYNNYVVYRDGDYVIFDADVNTTDCFYGKITIYMPEPSTGSSGGSSSGSSSTTVVEEVEEETATLNKEDHFAYMQGYPDETFRASNNITRAETVVMFARLLTESMEEDTVYTSSFTDITGTEWYASQVGYMEQFDIVNGYENHTFGGNDYITRAEFATIASRFDELAETQDNVFSDVLASHWAVDYINSAAEKGWVTGYEDGTFKPSQYITRAEAVTLVNRVLERICDEDYADEYMDLLVQFTDLSDTHWAYSDIVEATNGHDYTKDDEGNETWIEIYDHD